MAKKVIKSWNKGAERVFGYTADEAVGKPVTILIPRERLGTYDSWAYQARRADRTL
jgi:PAS domain S-box-containing protein